jgi:hypothetical protein
MNVHVMPNGHLKWNKRRKHINVKSRVCMQAYWNRLWAAVSSFTEESTPLLARRRATDDVESCVPGGRERVAGERVAGEPAEVRVQVGPFAEEHFA